MNIVILFLLLNTFFSLNINNFYREQFPNETRDPHLILTNESSSSEIPLIKFTEDIPINSTLLKIDKNQTIISCSKFPFSEILFNYMIQYFSIKKIAPSWYSETFNLVFKILYYKYAPLELIKKVFKSENISSTEEYEYNISRYLMEYIDVIYSQLNTSKYNHDYNKYNKDFIKRYKLEENFIANDIYDYIIEAITLDKNQKYLNFIKPFLFNRKDEFLQLYNYITIKGFSILYSQYEEFYLGIKRNQIDYTKLNYVCVYLSPITDMLDSKINLINKMYPFNGYPVLNESFLLQSSTPLDINDNNGLLTKYLTLSNENIFFHYISQFDEFKELNLNKFIYLKLIDIIIPNELIDDSENRKTTLCQILSICKGLVHLDRDRYRMPSFISSTLENPDLFIFGRLLFLDKDIMDKKNKEQFNFFLRSLASGYIINDDNELLSQLYLYQQLNREMDNYKDFFYDIINKEKEIEENKDLFKLIELNLKVVLINYNYLLDKMEKIIINKIIDL